MSIDIVRELVECMEAAIQSGDWKVDGACDPTLVLLRAKKCIAIAQTQEQMWDLQIFGATFTKDGKRISPDQFFKGDI